MSKPIDQERALFEAHWAKYVGVPIEHVKSWRKGESYSGRYAACVIAWESWHARAQLPTSGGPVPEPYHSMAKQLVDDWDSGHPGYDIAGMGREAVEILRKITAAPHPVSGEQNPDELHRLDKQCRDDVARSMGLNPKGDGYAWSCLLEGIKIMAPRPAAQDVSALIDVATGKIQHARNGMCPDLVEGFKVSDPECPACLAIAAHRAQAQGGDV